MPGYLSNDPFTPSIAQSIRNQRSSSNVGGMDDVGLPQFTRQELYQNQIRNQQGADTRRLVLPSWPPYHAALDHDTHHTHWSPPNTLPPSNYQPAQVISPANVYDESHRLWPGKKSGLRWSKVLPPRLDDSESPEERSAPQLPNDISIPPLPYLPMPRPPMDMPTRHSAPSGSADLVDGPFTPGAPLTPNMDEFDLENTHHPRGKMLERLPSAIYTNPNRAGDSSDDGDSSVPAARLNSIAGTEHSIRSHSSYEITVEPPSNPGSPSAQPHWEEFNSTSPSMGPYQGSTNLTPRSHTWEPPEVFASQPYTDASPVGLLPPKNSIIFEGMPPVSGSSAIDTNTSTSGVLSATTPIFKSPYRPLPQPPLPAPDLKAEPGVEASTPETLTADLSSASTYRAHDSVSAALSRIEPLGASHWRGSGRTPKRLPQESFPMISGSPIFQPIHSRRRIPTASSTPSSTSLSLEPAEPMVVPDQPVLQTPPLSEAKHLNHIRSSPPLRSATSPDFSGSHTPPSYSVPYLFTPLRKSWVIPRADRDTTCAGEGEDPIPALTAQDYVITFVTATLPRQIYLHFLLRLPSLYFSRVDRIFKATNLTMEEIKEMALQATAEESKNIQYDMLQGGHQLVPEPTKLSPAYQSLKSGWEHFIDNLMREWKTLNIVSVLLLSAIMTMFQIQGAAQDLLTRYMAFWSLLCALMSVLYGCLFIIRFGTMRKASKAAEWALEAQRSQTVIWNVWVMLAMPIVWLAWSILTFIACIMSFMWRVQANPPSDFVFSATTTTEFAFRVFICGVLGIGVVYGALIMNTFRRYGAQMDEAWQRRVESYLGHIYNIPQLSDPLPPPRYPHTSRSAAYQGSSRAQYRSSSESDSDSGHTPELTAAIGARDVRFDAPEPIMVPPPAEYQLKHWYGGTELQEITTQAKSPDRFSKQWATPSPNSRSVH
ncbi:hypothetical protein NP233_g8292 [Leucocoprinus birnbaumii]|uniref:Uncharacterized protein n=1 Tax=Leucocoprinus birnbaumii TaxID=56174 RepID=A0AAD5YNA4_9AGAR|nr:hypothetical protein NP233_g8292 [Leucocoprinus birnbaumii]